MFNYKAELDSLAFFMAKEGYTKKPFPKIIFHNEEQELFGRTGYYDPSAKEVHLFVGGRHPKDILRSFAHELIHHKQNLDGRLNIGDYSGTDITEDNKLLELEKEAFLKGNIGFRSWTEIEKKKGNDLHVYTTDYSHH